MAFWLSSAQKENGEKTPWHLSPCVGVFSRTFFSLSPNKLLTTQAALQGSSFTMKICVEEKGGKRITTVCYALLITLAWKKVRYKFWFHVALFCEIVEWFWTKTGLVLWQNILMRVQNVNKANGLQYHTPPISTPLSNLTLPTPRLFHAYFPILTSN